MTEIEELIKQAEEVLKHWQKPKPAEGLRLSNRSWQEILDGKGYDPKQVSYIASRPGGI